MRHKLSICIPTYNRAEYLQATLENIFDNISSNIEVVIYDGASTDNTAQLLYEWSLKHVNLTYFIADKNGGVDKDIENVVSLARSEYCWLMSSDDYITPNSIDKILEILTEYSPKVLLFDRINCDKHMRPISEEKWLDLDNKLNVYDFRKSEGLETYLKTVRNLGGIFSYMSSIVVKKSAWMKYTGDPTLIGTNYNHVGNILQVLLNCGSLVYLQKPLVLCREENDSFSDNGLPSRFLIDFKGYHKIGQAIFKDNIILKDKFYEVLRKDHHVLRLIKIRSYCKSSYEWKEIEEYLLKLNYNRRIVNVANYIGSISRPIKTIFLLRNVVKKWLR